MLVQSHEVSSWVFVWCSESTSTETHDGRKGVESGQALARERRVKALRCQRHCLSTSCSSSSFILVSEQKLNDSSMPKMSGQRSEWRERLHSNPSRMEQELAIKLQDDGINYQT